MENMKRVIIEAPAVAIHGNDIDTDRIVPARFLKCVTFDGLGEHAFEDDRLQLTAAGKVHPLDVPSHSEARIMVVNKNFGCGSSREHAPQAIMRWGKGIQALVGESFAEIFFANCVALGVPCLTVSESDAVAIQQTVDSDPTVKVTVDLAKQQVRVGDRTFTAEIPEGVRQQFVEGTWDATVELLAALPAVQTTAGNLPYVSNWKA